MTFYGLQHKSSKLPVVQELLAALIQQIKGFGEELDDAQEISMAFYGVAWHEQRYACSPGVSNRVDIEIESLSERIGGAGCINDHVWVTRHEQQCSYSAGVARCAGSESEKL